MDRKDPQQRTREHQCPFAKMSDDFLRRLMPGVDTNRSAKVQDATSIERNYIESHVVHHNTERNKEPSSGFEPDRATSSRKGSLPQATVVRTENGKITDWAAAVTRRVSLIEFPNGSSQCLVEGESQ